MRVTLPLFAVAVATGVSFFACGEPGGSGNAADWDVRGNYTLTYDNQLRLKLDLGGAVREVTANGYGQVVDFGTYNGEPLTLDLNAFCARPEVSCPSETLWTAVAVDQKDAANKQNLYALSVIDNRDAHPPAGVRALAVGGVVDHSQQDRFLLGLGAQGGAQNNCGALAISLAGGRFTHQGERLVPKTVYRNPQGQSCNPDAGSPADAGSSASDGGSWDGGALETCEPKQIEVLEIPSGAPVNGITEGKVAVAWLGGCAFGPVVAAATLTLETGYVGVRTGAFSAPEYTPPPSFDGGVDAGSP